MSSELEANEAGGKGRFFDIIVRIVHFPPAQGGLSYPLVGIVRPWHNFGDDADPFFCSGFMNIAEPGIAPGEFGETVVSMVCDEAIRQMLTVGMKWSLQHGFRQFGTAEMLAEIGWR